MAFQNDSVEVTIEFSQERAELPVLELTDLLSSLNEMYRVFYNNNNIILDILPDEMNEELFYDNEARDMFIGRLYRYGVLSELTEPRIVRRPLAGDFYDNYEGLNIRTIHKESPLIIGMTGGGMFIAVLWVIEGIEYERNVRKIEDEDGKSHREVESRFEFNATTTRDLISEIRKFLK
jgi:hypothetical protein